jgi:head-tail adaptor
MAARAGGAGKLREVLSFQSREIIDDGAGNEVSGPWVEQCKAAAERVALRGTETVTAARLSGKQPYLVTVRHAGNTSAVTTDWRAVDDRTGKSYAITSAVPREKRDYIDMLMVEGLAE